MAGGAYIKIKDGNIYFHAPGTIEHKGAAHPFMGPTSLPKEMPRLPSSELSIKNQFALVDNFYGVRMPNQKYRITLEDGTVYSGKTDDQGITEVIESHIPQQAEIEIIDNVTGKSGFITKVYMGVSDDDYTYTGTDTRTENIGTGLPFNNNYCSPEQIKLRAIIMADYDFGLRLAESCPKDKEGNDWRYPVAEEFYEKICRVLEKAVDWVAMCGELDKLKQLEKGSTNSGEFLVEQDFINKGYYEPIADQIKGCCHAILGSAKATPFQTPASFPGIPSEKEDWKRKEMIIKIVIGNPQDPDYYKNDSETGGYAQRSSDRLLLSLNPNAINRYAYAQSDLQKNSQNVRNLLKLIAARADLIGFIFHEMRHFQHFFWAIAYAQLCPADFLGANASDKIRQGLENCLFNSNPVHCKQYIDKNRTRFVQALDTTNCQNNNHLKIGLKRILLTNIYISVHESNKSHYAKYYPEFQIKLLELMEQEFQHPGEGGEKINYTKFLSYNDGPKYPGYYLTPFEDDAHATQGIMLYYEQQSFDKSKEKLKKDEFAFFHNEIESKKVLPSKLPKPTDHSTTYPTPEKRNSA